jgi:hypothetical protein
LLSRPEEEDPVSRSRLLVLLLALSLPVWLAACGGGDGGGSEDEDQVTEVIETSSTSTDPADCATLATQAFLDQTETGTGQEAVASCEENAADTSDDPDSVDVSDVQVDGSSATATVAFNGGTFGGSTLTVGLVKEGDQWKLDEVTDITEFDFEAFKQNLTDSFTASGDVPPEIADCITQALDQAGEDQVKSIVLSGDDQALLDLFAPCA